MSPDKFFRSMTPENAGISSADIENLIKTIEERGVCLHSYLILKGDAIVSEGYYPPFDEKYLHRAYSVSKSFTATAIGALADEGKIALGDKVYQYFMDKIPPEGLHPYVEEASIEDLLKMQSPFRTDAYDPCPQNMDWAWTFFNTKPSHPSGTIFRYDTCGTYILNVIVERVTGMPYMNYLYERILKHMDFSKDTWCIKSPEGYSWGGSGVMATLRDLARLGYLYLNKGKVRGKQLLSEEFASKAVKPLTNPLHDSNFAPHRHGYGYQMWCTKEGFAFMGLGSQLCFVFPQKDLIFCVNGDTQGNPTGYSTVYYAFEDNILRKMSNGPLPEDKAAQNKLEEKLNNLSLPVPFGSADSPLIDLINGKTIKCDRNPMGISEYSLCFEGEEGVFTYHTVRGVKKLKFGLAKHVEATFPETHYFAEQINVPHGRELRCTSAGAWFNENEFMIQCYIIDCCFGNCFISFGFRDDRVTLLMTKSAEWFMNEYQGFAGGKLIEEVGK